MLAINIVSLFIIISLSLSPPFSCQSVSAGVLSRSLAKVAARKAATRKTTTGTIQKRNWKKIYTKDRARDNRTAAKPLKRDRNVYRYTSMKDARSAKKNGIPAHAHMTPNTSKGRPISSKTAQKRYGIQHPPEALVTIKIPKGHPVKFNKAIGGERGRGEITSPKDLPPSQVTDVKPMK